MIKAIKSNGCVFVRHPAMWRFCGYKEIQEPRRKNILIDYERLQRLVGAKFYDQLRSSHKGWVEEYLGDNAKERQDEWTDSIAEGSRFFIENVKALLGFKAKGREVRQGGGSRYQLREDAAQYKALFRVEKDNIDPKTPIFGTLRLNNQALAMARPGILRDSPSFS